MLQLYVMYVSFGQLGNFFCRHPDLIDRYVISILQMTLDVFSYYSYIDSVLVKVVNTVDWDNNNDCHQLKMGCLLIKSTRGHLFFIGFVFIKLKICTNDCFIFSSVGLILISSCNKRFSSVFLVSFKSISCFQITI